IGNIEIVMPAMYVYQAKGLIAQNPDGIQKIKASTDQNLKNFYKDYDPDLDRKVAKAMMKLYKDNVSAEELPECYNTISASYGGSIDSFIDNVYDKSVFTTLEGAEKALADINAASAATSDDNASSEDPATQLLLEGVSKMSRTMSPAATSQSDFALGKKLFTKGQLEMKQGEPIYPDANFTMRLTYGLVKPYSPKDGVTYDYYTTLDGVMEKEDSTSWEFIVPKKLKQIYAAKDYGRWGLPDGKMPACFIMTGDITGGNSGSPVMNAKGELVGLAFDGNWESMSGDIIFEPQLQRCICVDIRYVMMILEKYGNAGYLLKEMKFD
ncbi:MAG: S46 family peptidase, partial [Bacteroidales bacterium]